jgi:hypothetical protein
MKRAIAVAGVIGAMAAGLAWGQPALFDKVTLRYLPHFSPPGIHIRDGDARVVGVGLRSLFAQAYGVKDYQIAGGPASVSKMDHTYEIDLTRSMQATLGCAHLRMRSERWRRRCSPIDSN